MYPKEYFDTFWRGDLKDEVFVIMSFNTEFDAVWSDAIRPAIEQDIPDRSFFAHRVDASVLTSNIVNEILDGVAHARLVFADVSVCTEGRWAGQRNGNAMYEVGLAHAIRQPAEIVMVRDDDEPLSFDIAQIKTQQYDRSDLAAARTLFASLLQAYLGEIDMRKALKVEDAVWQLDMDCLMTIAQHGKAPYFSTPLPKTMRDVMAASGVRAAVARMLSLGLIRCDADMQAGRYAYHWTPFGEAVLARVGVR